jgi:hypothetical protein
MYIPFEVWIAEEDRSHASLLLLQPGQIAAHTSEAHYTTDKKDLPAASLLRVYIFHTDSVINSNFKTCTHAPPPHTRVHTCTHKYIYIVTCMGDIG